MPTGFEHDQYIAQVELVKAINRLAKVIEDMKKGFTFPHIVLDEKQMKELERIVKEAQK